MIVRELITRFGFDVDEAALKQIDAGVDNIKTGLLGIAGVAATVAVALYGVVKTTADGAGEMKTAALAAGVAIDTFQTLGYAAKLSGSNIQEMGVGLRFLSRNIAMAAKDVNGELNKSFRNLGVSVFDATGRLKTADEVFLDLSAAFTKINDPARKTQIAMELLGKSGTTLIETLNKGPDEIRRLQEEAEAFGVMTAENVQVLGDFSDALNRVFFIFGAIKKMVAVQLAPVLTEMINDFRTFLVTNKEIIKTNITGFMNGIISVAKVLWMAFQRVGQVLAFVAKMLGGAETATKLLLYSILFLSSTFVVAGIMGLVTAVKLLGWAFFVALAKALIIPALITAAIIALALVIEDFWTYLEGGDSVIGVLIEDFKIFGQIAMGMFRQVKQAAVDLWNFLTSKLANFSFGGISNFLGFGSTGSTSAQTGSPAGVVRGGGNSQNITVGSPQIEVNVPEGTPASLVGPSITDGIRQGFENILAPANRATAPSVRY